MKRILKKKAASANGPTLRKEGWIHNIRRNYPLYLMILPPLIILIVFSYIPMLGAQIAFRNYRIVDGIWGSKWVGLDHFARFFASSQFGRLMKNTLSLSVWSLIANTIFPIILALMLNECRNRFVKKALQMFSYAPYFISTVVLVAMMYGFLYTGNGLFNVLIEKFGGESINFIGNSEYFLELYVWSGTWQMTGFNSIIYLAALSGVSSELHEAALMDGASKFRRIRTIDLPHILPTAVTLFILNVGNILRVGFEKVYLMQNDQNMLISEVISTYVYKTGITNQQYSYATAVNFFNSLVGLILILIVNSIAKRVNDTSLW